MLVNVSNREISKDIFAILMNIVILLRQTVMGKMKSLAYCLLKIEDESSLEFYNKI